jgi:hypothetical protein
MEAEMKSCEVCSRPSGLRKYCATCERLLESAKRHGIARDAAVEVLVDRWDEERQAFVCKYTNVPMTTTGGARNATWEHATPQDNSDVTLAAALINRAKVDLNVDQWHHLIRALYATRIEDQPFDETVFPENWQPKANWNLPEPPSPSSGS